MRDIPIISNNLIRLIIIIHPINILFENGVVLVPKRQSCSNLKGKITMSYANPTAMKYVNQDHGKKLLKAAAIGGAGLRTRPGPCLLEFKAAK